MHNTIGLFGGTFDPIHKGHVRSAIELKQRLSLNELRLIPSHRPPHRESLGCSSIQRLAMVELALPAGGELVVDDREIKRDAISYTVDTLEQLRNELGEQVSLCWIMGTDAFLSLDSWHRWEQLPTLAHLVVIARPDYELPDTGPVAQMASDRRCADKHQLRQQPAGLIHFERLNEYPVSATLIRETISMCWQHAEKPRPLHDDMFLRSVLAAPVLDYIEQHQLYR